MPYLHKDVILAKAREIANESGLTQEEIAKELGKSQASVSRALGSDTSRDWTPLRLEIIRVIGPRIVEGPFWHIMKKK